VSTIHSPNIKKKKKPEVTILSLSHTLPKPTATTKKLLSASWLEKRIFYFLNITVRKLTSFKNMIARKEQNF
jgi:hypothetical protein